MKPLFALALLSATPSFAATLEGTSLPVEGTYNCTSYETNQEFILTIPSEDSGQKARLVGESDGFSPRVDRSYKVGDVALEVLERVRHGLAYTLYLQDRDSSIVCFRN